ncbi:glycosyltransferase family 4 protein [Pseudomaricurvus alcaniphilus]|uniref:glycosyltransferase family 4 protein n=1 Tax=Pseudomaricurvus alcaniphilus TaxID=1166482 RepID=UPI00140A91EB|nr:glycosyltransferase family 4 protein [Pseudomaricurvus alcaniphilus]NHN38101.1 glycosyltransferase family 4 protein [Pseudomaricurvus alcaniphilus]
MSKVLVISTSYPTAKNPSAGAFVANLAKALSKKHQVKVLAPSLKGEARQSHENDGPELVLVRYAPNSLEVLAQNGGGIPAALKKNRLVALLVPGLILGFFIQILRRIHQVDFIQANWIVSGFIVAVPAMLYQKPLITTLHGEDVRKLKSSVLYRVMFLLACRASRKIVCVGEEMCTKVIAEFPRYSSKIVYIPNGVDKHLFLPRQKSREIRGEFRILMVSSLIESKSIDHALVALAEIKDDYPGVMLDIVGAGPEMNKLIDCCERLGLADRVKFHGAIAQNEVYKQYLDSDVLLICSKAEGRSSVVLEALALGVPVIGSRSEGIRELLEDAPASKMYQYGSISGLVAAIKEMHSLCLNCEYGSENRRYLESLSLTWESTAEKYTSIFLKKG